MSDADRDKWNRIYQGRGEALGDPASFLIASAEHLPASGRALDIAGGAGRNALWLARRGLDVTLADISPVALATASSAAAAAVLTLSVVELDLEDQAAGLGDGWDVIVIFHYLDRSLLGRIERMLAPGGVLLFCQPTVRNLERHAKPSKRFLLEEGEIGSLLGGLEIVSLEEGWSDEGRHEARVVAVRPGR